MSAAPAESSPAEERFLADYAEAFEHFVRHLRRQGFLIDEHILEAAHDRAQVKATQAAHARGHRTLPVAPLARTGLARARVSYGY